MVSFGQTIIQFLHGTDSLVSLFCPSVVQKGNFWAFHGPGRQFKCEFIKQCVCVILLLQ